MKKIRDVVLYIDNSAYRVFESDTSGTGKKVMLSIFKHMDKDTNLVCINGNTLDSIISDTGLSSQQVRDKVSELKKLELITPTGSMRAEYIVDPCLATKGSYEKVWRAYGLIEKNIGDEEATVPYTGQVVLVGKSLPLTDDDYKDIGREIKRDRDIKH